MLYSKIEWFDKVMNDLENRSKKSLWYCAEYLTSKIKDQLQYDSYDTWNLANSITWNFVSNDEAEVWTNLEYALVREYWRRPWKFPPLDSLVGWTARKGMITWWATQRYDDLHYTDKGVIFVIARAIATRWIEWKHTFENVYNNEKQNIVDLYNELMRNVNT